MKNLLRSFALVFVVLCIQGCSSDMSIEPENITLKQLANLEIMTSVEANLIAQRSAKGSIMLIEKNTPKFSDMSAYKSHITEVFAGFPECQSIYFDSYNNVFIYDKNAPTVTMQIKAKVPEYFNKTLENDAVLKSIAAQVDVLEDEEAFKLLKERMYKLGIAPKENYILIKRNKEFTFKGGKTKDLPGWISTLAKYLWP
jgi:hypothetical protein